MAGFELTLVLVIDKLFLEEVIEMSQTCCEAGTESHGPAWRPAELHSIQPSCLWQELGFFVRFEWVNGI